jgi:Ca-activated chloride channel family protein
MVASSRLGVVGARATISRGFALGALVVGTGGLVLVRADAAVPPPREPPPVAVAVASAPPPAPPSAPVRGPIALAVVLDTSGSMGGPKLENAKASILRLLARMKDTDEIALVRYDDTSELVLPLTPVSAARETLPGRLADLRPAGGSNVPGALSSGLRALDDAAKERGRRLVLVSDGVEDPHLRAQSASLARRASDSGITVSSLVVGRDRYDDVDLDRQAF